MSKSDRQPTENHWNAFNEGNTLTGLVLLAIAGVTYFAGKYDYVSVLEYWTLAVVCIAWAIYIGRNASEKRNRVLLVSLAVTAIGAGA
jgi:hypothetical protein